MTSIQTEKQYNAAMSRIEELLRIVNEDTPEDNQDNIELVLLSNLVADYEDIHYPIKKPSLIDVLKLRMYEKQLSQKALANLLNISPSKISEILSGKSEPTLKQARQISSTLDIAPAVVLGL